MMGITHSSAPSNPPVSDTFHCNQYAYWGPHLYKTCIPISTSITHITNMPATASSSLRLLFFTFYVFGAPTADGRSTYIVQMDPSAKPDSFDTHESWHLSTLSSSDQLLYSYNHLMQGFSATLSPFELALLRKSPGHVSSIPDTTASMFTTHTPSFLGLDQQAGIWPASSQGRHVIIGLIDTGIRPESPSFNDQGMPPPPATWNGTCESGDQFESSLCNNKLIGARSFNKGLKASGTNISIELDFDSPRDFIGHGTHTSSTAAGAYVPNVDYYGYAKGLASGIAPGAHVAVYKVLWATGPLKCMTSDILAGMDRAAADGVDVMSLSIGTDTHTPYYTDVIAIAALAAVRRGITVICAAGNEGPRHSEIYNGAPWIINVGAGTVARTFLARLTLGDGKIINGVSYYPESIYIADAPLYHGGQCKAKTLNPAVVYGKVVVCDLGEEAHDISAAVSEIDRSGALAAVIFADPMVIDPEQYYRPVVAVRGAAATTVRAYLAQAGNLTVKELRFVITELGSTPAPQVAFFSSRGPYPVTPSVLKPDLIAPGKDVLAAWAPNHPYGQAGRDYLATDYALVSGTSMAAPHVAGVAALIRAVHRNWSPAAIRSAMMTTSTTIDNTGERIRDEMTHRPASPLDFGAGFVNPNRAMDPGLVYDVKYEDYIDFLCGLDYSKAQVSAVVRGSKWSCEPRDPRELNYPSFMAVFNNQSHFPLVRRFRRVVTNVGDEEAIYRAVLEVPKGVRMRIEPKVLVFSKTYEELSFVLDLEIGREAEFAGSVVYGFLRWVDGNDHVVSSPVVATTS